MTRDELRDKAGRMRQNAQFVREIALKMSLEADKVKLIGQAAELELQAEQLMISAEDAE